MKRLGIIFSLFVIVLSLASCVSSSGHGIRSKLSVREMVSHEGYSTVALVEYNEDNLDNQVSDVRLFCSGVWVDSGHILTAYHCVEAVRSDLQKKRDAREKAQAERNEETCNLYRELFGRECPVKGVPHITVGINNLPIHFIQWGEVGDVGKEPTAWHLSNVVSWDERHDLALVEAAGNEVPSHQVAEVASEVPGLAERVHIVGHTRGMSWSFMEGVVAGYRGGIPHVDDTDGPFLQIQAPIAGGNSGGGAFNDYGELVGIADFTLKSLPAEGFFIPVYSIRHFLGKRVK